MLSKSLGNFKLEWYIFFAETMSTLANSKTKFGGKTITVKDGIEFVSNDKLHSGIQSTIDDILIWSRKFQLS